MGYFYDDIKFISTESDVFVIENPSIFTKDRLSKLTLIVNDTLLIDNGSAIYGTYTDEENPTYYVYYHGDFDLFLYFGGTQGTIEIENWLSQELNIHVIVPIIDPIDFPNTPSINDTKSRKTKTWTWDGSVWYHTNLPSATSPAQFINNPNINDNKSIDEKQWVWNGSYWQSRVNILQEYIFSPTSGWYLDSNCEPSGPTVCDESELNSSATQCRCIWENWTSWSDQSSCTPSTPDCSLSQTQTECRVEDTCSCDAGWGSWTDVSSCSISFHDCGQIRECRTANTCNSPSWSGWFTWPGPGSCTETFHACGKNRECDVQNTCWVGSWENWQSWTFEGSCSELFDDCEEKVRECDWDDYCDWEYQENYTDPNCSALTPSCSQGATYRTCTPIDSTCSSGGWSSWYEDSNCEVSYHPCGQSTDCKPLEHCDFTNVTQDWTEVPSCTESYPACTTGAVQIECRGTTCIWSTWSSWSNVSSCTPQSPACSEGAIQRQCSIHYSCNFSAWSSYSDSGCNDLTYNPLCSSSSYVGETYTQCQRKTIGIPICPGELMEFECQTRTVTSINEQDRESIRIGTILLEEKRIAAVVSSSQERRDQNWSGSPATYQVDVWQGEEYYTELYRTRTSGGHPEEEAQRTKNFTGDPAQNQKRERSCTGHPTQTQRRTRSSRIEAREFTCILLD